MTNSPLRPTEAVPPTPPATGPLLNWSEDQVVRLEYEWARLQRAFAYHPHVRIVSMRDDPPGEYEIEFRVRTLVVGESGALEYADAAPVRIWLPPSFPYTAPSVRPLSGLFHPNVSWEGVHLSSGWQPTDTLVAFVKKIGELLAWRVYDPDAVANPLALDWLEQNPTLIPLDGQADFAPEAGGLPLERIRTYGQATLEQIAAQMTDLQQALLEANPAPAASQVRDVCRRTRMALKLFLADDVPQTLREQAMRLDDWANALPQSLDAWDFVRARRAAAQAARAACRALLALRDPLRQQLARLEAMAPSVVPRDVASALEALPEAATLERARLEFPELVDRARKARRALRDRLAALDGDAPPLAIDETSAAARRLREKIGAVAALAQAARKSADASVGEIDPLLGRAAAESEALRRVALWREYFDLLHVGREMEKKLAMWGGAGIHAYYIENESGRFGPFQFEQAIDLGSSQLAVRSAGAKRIELIDARTARTLANSDIGSLSLDVPGTHSAERYRTVFQLTDRCEELAVQLDFLIRQAAQLLGQLDDPAQLPQSWCGKLLGVLADLASQRPIREDYRRAIGRWGSILRDVRALEPLKARIETWHLVHRLVDASPRIVRALADEQVRLRKSTHELAGIIARCGRDLDSGQLVIPPNLAKPYTHHVQLRDQSQREIARAEKRLAALAAQVGQRLASPAMFGSNALPQLSALPPLPQGFSASVAVMDDAALDEQIVRLEQALNRPLRTAAWDAARDRTPRPAASEPEQHTAIETPPQTFPAEDEQTFVVEHEESSPQ